ncbi:MAG: hypothetical protein HYU46_00965 [Deltaproteobacteria bacterium]|nr:hypothetical protein [Deltaproteobacteria bacterium]MBI2365385.1 hypothetical protein [Deltaproteobacteria bacterium]MBI3063568.1 hypothetical protein [Deltaproteobacteria bacterium]
MSENQFYEMQYFPAVALMLGVGLVFHLLRISHIVSLPLNTTIAVLLWFLSFLFIPQKIVVDERAVQIEFGWLPFTRHTIPLENIAGSKTITQVMPGDFWAAQQDGTAPPSLIAGSGEILILSLKDGSHFPLNSQRIKELQHTIEIGRQKSGNPKQDSGERKHF